MFRPVTTRAERKSEISTADHRTKHPGSTTHRERILQVAAELFATNGYHGTGVAELGDAVGIGRGALYHHIGSKEQLLYDICSRHVEELIVHGERLAPLGLAPEEKLRALARIQVRAIVDRLPEVTVFFREMHALTGERRERLIAIRRHFEDIWRQIIEQGAADGVFRSADWLTVKGVLNLYNYSYVWIDPQGSSSAEQIADGLSEIALHGLAGGTRSLIDVNHDADGRDPLPAAAERTP
jgi:AcrR family transcriptional regulator